MDNLKINVASFEDGERLQQAFFDVVRKTGVTISDLMGEENLDKVVNLALAVNSDREVYNALWPCLAKCTYNGEKITKSTFEDVSVREHYYPVLAKCLEANITPFIAGLRLVLGGLRNPDLSSIQK